MKHLKMTKNLRHLSTRKYMGVNKTNQGNAYTAYNDLGSDNGQNQDYSLKDEGE